MSEISKIHVLKGWVNEFLWFAWFYLQSAFSFFINHRHKPGRRPETVIIVADAFQSALPYGRLAKLLQGDGFQVHVISTGSVIRNLREHAQNLAAFLEEHDVRDGILIGHGMGSLVALSLPDAGRQRISHLISMGSAFYGSRLFMWMPFIPALRDMAVGSDYLLFHRMNSMLFASFSPFSAWQDQWIIPFNLSQFGQGRDLIFDQVGHYNLIAGAENLQTLRDFLREWYPAPTTAVEQARLQLSEAQTNAQVDSTRQGTRQVGRAAAGSTGRTGKRSARPGLSSKKTASRGRKKSSVRQAGKSTKKKVAQKKAKKKAKKKARRR